MTQKIIITGLILALIYLYYQNKKLQQLPHSTSPDNSTRDEDKEDLIAEKDAAIRSKNEAEQEVLSLSNQLRNKQSELTRKESEIERLKKESSQKEISLNKKITEKNGLITTLQREVNQAKEKYSKQGQLLDTEQLENNKLSEQITKLEEQITELTRSKSPMPGEFPNEDELTKQHQEQLRKINLLFDDQAQDYPQIDFNGLYSLLQNIADEQKKKKTSRTSSPEIPKKEINYSLDKFIN